MSFNQPPPNPYGQQTGPQPGYGYPQQGGVPPQPNPYGQPGQPPTNPYGQPPANAPYGQPQQPNPYGQQPGWGGQVPPPPPVKKSNAGKVIGILAAVVVVAGAGIAFAVVGGAAGGGGDYKLTTPDTVLGGQYSKDSAASSDMASKMPSSGSDSNISNGTPVSGAWKSSKDEVIFAGAYGSVSDPKTAVDTMMNGAVHGASTTDEHPSGFDGDVMKCGTQSAGIIQQPFCAWGDSSTVAMAIWMPNIDPANPTSMPTAPSVSDWAQTTAKLRSEVRVKK
ncbi:hypothetical protein ABZ746_07100 [Streptomyces sp. NPDC020096]